MAHASFWMSSAHIHELLRAYGLWILFVVLTIECIGIPLPGEAMLVSAAIYAGSTHRIALASVLFVAAAGTISGSMIGYVIGRSIGFRLLLHYGKHIWLDERRLKVGQYLFLKHGGQIVFFGRFIDPLRIFGGILAGTNRMSWTYFLLMNSLGGAVWVLLLGGGAYLFGVETQRVAGLVSLVLLFVAVGLVVGGLIFFRRHEKELEQRAEEAIPGPLMDVAARPNGLTA